MLVRTYRSSHRRGSRGAAASSGVAITLPHFATTTATIVDGRLSSRAAATALQSTPQTSPIAYIPLLRHDESSIALRTLGHLGRHWIVRGAPGTRGFFTLGRAAHLDVAGSHSPDETYSRQLGHQNGILRQYFGHLLNRVRETLSGYLGAPTILSERLAVPGFHIAFGHTILHAARLSERPLDHHKDLSWSSPPDQHSLFSFTLPLALPRAGLHLIATAPGIPATILPHVRGALTIQHGRFFQRTRATPDLRNDDEHIALQGHGIRVGDSYVLHW